MFGVSRLVRRDPAVTLRVLMAERNINVSELAAMTGLSTTTISALRTGRTRCPNPDTAQLIATDFGVRTSNIWPNR